MHKDRVNIYLRIIREGIDTDTWLLYKRKDKSYALDIDNGDGTSGIYLIDNAEILILNGARWEPVVNMIDYIERNLCYVDTGQPVYLSKEFNKENK